MNVTLTTTGHKSGQLRDVPLYAFEDGDLLVIVGSSAGRPKDPAWVANLRAEPRAKIRRGRENMKSMPAKWRAPERDRLWRLVSEAFPLYETYERRTTRTIPLFVLEPAGDA